MSQTDQNTGLTSKRIESLADGIFAIAMTLLVLDLQLDGPVGNIILSQFLANQWQRFLNYLLSFFLLAIFWILHHQQFHVIKRTDRRHLWINVLMLMFVALIPFSASVVGDFFGQTLAHWVFDLNLFVVGLLFYFNWAYATNQYRLVEKDLSIDLIARGKKRALVLPIVTCLAFVLSFYIPPWSGLAYLLIPVIFAKLKA
ncbi:hypothetical protein A2291_04190 [candidate division WOR-1 bacterium RIFOXYB2_FULL_42_35]|uniref:DUF1211 domain-containing membrane protein n=1 Tax=candidate division WOR-1 bacterium RIFOXYC2_FULL_41_25 TaxID=1802586 RepID=A0A1F4TPM5_UNCSA|nr:MAG: hypothetical protein A2247_01030 [candidate division WOR-1 bacterium RIFOXYA2_FULL_41_14]OGC24331.1 MAG: hypothetical protein A2291_04190 [candidate division WOR-1 bacterium RIFOXYB2_FULL_42_35]OGC34033.1 MAG: hypothetical protein A2462_01595 [candidate division WOR-1 bacterium RIFOXYC2_FULL_41_25]OGC42348.1 MAG: hypothetical protein A2548_07305 [candidate division WOR-1 bacterium RIFOXYD2_FULL_41_8]